MKKTIFSLAILMVFSYTSFAQSENKLVAKKSHFKFYSHTAVEDIEANNYKAVGTINIDNGEIVFSVPMQSYEFEKAKMQQHYNSKKFLDTKQFPKSKLKGKITNLSDVSFDKNGTYNVNVEGDLNLHGVTKSINEKATITVKGDNVVLNTKFNLTLADYAIAFKDGKPSTNIAKTIEISVVAEY
ncbi:MAG: YceI family protein [Flavobacteriaceae bacterium]|nr:YceI family protein [Flavobacteriaceae bacterium]